MNTAANEQRRPSLTPGYVPASRETSRVVTQVESPTPHRGWHSRGYLPHWDHPGMIQSLNFRLTDAMPSSVLAEWRQELALPLGAPAPCRRGPRESATTRRQGDGAPRTKTDDERHRELEWRRRIEDYLDAGHGACWLRRPEIARVVKDTLLLFDPERYRLLAWCVMPNHVHALIETQEGFSLAKILHSWKSYTSKVANDLLGRSSEFWQREYHDRYIRNAEHFEKVVAYIEENPVKAGLAKLKTEWLWSSANWRAGFPGSAGALPAR